jgi:subtilisin family serine protease
MFTRPSVSVASSTKAITLALLCILAPTMGAMTVTAATGNPVNEHGPGEIQQFEGQPSYIVAVEDNESISEVQDWAGGADEREIVAYRNASNYVVVAAPTITVRTFNVLSIQAFQQSIRDVAVLETMGGVEQVSPNLVFSTPRDVTTQTQDEWASPVWSVDLILQADSSIADGIAFSGDSPHGTPLDYREWANATSVDATGEGVVGAVADTGCYGSTPTGEVYGNGTAGSELRISNASKDFVAKGEPTIEEEGYSVGLDENGHGSWASGAIFANVTPSGSSTDEMDGVLPDGTLMCLPVLDESGSGETDDIARAIRYAADHDADFISLSLGSPAWNQELSDAVAYAHDEGTLVFVATGNSATYGRSPGIATPADTDGAIAIGASNARPPENASRAYFSQYGQDTGSADLSGGVTRGESVDFIAPGFNVSATVLNENGLVVNKTLSGTSMSTPYVAGSAGVVIAAHPDWEPATVVDWLEDSASPVPNASVHEAGHGYPDVHGAINKQDAAETQTAAMTTEARFRNNLFAVAEGLFGGFF